MAKAENVPDKDLVYYGRLIRLKPYELQAGADTAEGNARLGQIVMERLRKNWTPSFERRGADGHIYQFDQSVPPQFTQVFDDQTDELICLLGFAYRLKRI